MRFTVGQDALAKGLSVVGKGIASTSTLPILSGIYIKAENGELELQTTNLTVSIKHRLAANVEEPGEAVISGRLLTNLVKNLPDEAVSFAGDGRVVDISCGKTSFRLNTLAAADFPEFPDYTLDRSVELPADILSKMVDMVYKVTSTDTSRPILSGVLMSVEQNTIRLVATDSYRLAVCDTNTETSSLDGSFEMIVPGLVFHDVLSLPGNESSILIGSTDSQIVFVFGNTTYVSRKIEGNYPNYKQLLPSSYATAAKLSTQELAAALRRVTVVANTNPSVRLDLMGKDSIRISSVSPDQGEAEEKISAEIEGEDVSIALNYHYVFDCINAISGTDEVSLELQSSSQPGIFKSYSKINYLYLLMPTRM